MDILEQDNVKFYYCYQCTYNIPVDEWKEPEKNAETQENTKPEEPPEAEPAKSEPGKKPVQEPKKTEDKDDLLEQPDEEIVYISVLKKDLNLLLKIDQDYKTNKKAGILDELDEYNIRVLISQETFGNDDFITAFKLVKHYKKNFTEDVWKELIASNQDYIKKKKSEGVKGCWMPIRWLNGDPTVYAGWEEGMPYTLSIRGRGIWNNTTEKQNNIKKSGWRSNSGKNKKT